MQKFTVFYIIKDTLHDIFYFSITIEDKQNKSLIITLMLMSVIIKGMAVE